MSQASRLWLGLVSSLLVLVVLGLTTGAQGWSWQAWLELVHGPDAALVLGQIRLPRTLGALLVGALLGLGGALAQGLFRNPLADPYLLGCASGASLGVVLVWVLTSGATGLGLTWLVRLGSVGAAFVGALAAVVLTLVLARGSLQTGRLLLAGVVVAAVLGAASDFLSYAVPEVLRAKQSFLLGSTSLLSWRSCAVLALGLAVTLPLVGRWARVLDALTLGEDTAMSLGLAGPLLRWGLVMALALATAVAVSQAGLIAFVGLVSPHLVRRWAAGTHGDVVCASSAMGACLLLGADVLARSLMAPQELPVGVLTAVLGGGYLLWQLRKQVPVC